MTTKRCAWCENLLPPPAAPEVRQKYCSPACRERYRTELRRPDPRSRYCYTCGSTFIQPALGRPRRSCSDTCRRKRSAWLRKQDLPVSVLEQRRRKA